MLGFPKSMMYLDPTVAQSSVDTGLPVSFVRIAQSRTYYTKAVIYWDVKPKIMIHLQKNNIILISAKLHPFTSESDDLDQDPTISNDDPHRKSRKKITIIDIIIIFLVRENLLY